MTNPNDPAADALKEQPFVSHLIELRDRLIRMVGAVGALFLVLFPFANDLYHLISKPLLAVLPDGQNMIATGVISPFLAPFKLALVAAIFIAMPVILYQLWAFIAPGLYKHERRVLMPMVGSSALLFYCGALFAYLVVFPLVFQFMKLTTPVGVDMIPDITQYLEFVLTLFFAFGLAFEVPIATVILVWMGVTTPDKLKEKRPFIIVGAFCIGMLLTPPDVISQTLLAFPMWVLFEVGLFFSRIVYRQRQARLAAEAAYPSAGDGVPGSGAQRPDAKPRGPSPAAPAALAPGEELTDFKGGPAADGPADDPGDSERFVPLSEQELDDELDLIEAEEAAREAADADEGGGLGEDDDEGLYVKDIDLKLDQVRWCRDQGLPAKARELLYEILAHGNDAQVSVARGILAEMDEKDGEPGWS
ncbi:MAG: twin-arginine translocase subunit TatC [Candidatus Sedimenticola endophacoides]